MTKNFEEKISPSSAGSLAYFLSQGCFLGITTGNIFIAAKTSSYLSAIIGIILSAIPLLFITYISKNTKREGIIDTINILFGRKLGMAINIVISLFFSVICIAVLYNFITFIDVEYMKETSKLYIASLLFIMFSYLLSKGIASICKASQIMFYMNIITIILTGLGVISDINVQNLFPVFEGGALGILKGSVLFAISSVMPIFVITLVGKKIVSDEKKYNKAVIIYYIMGTLSTLIYILLVTLSLGINIISLIRYGEYAMLEQIKIFYIFERVQNIFAIQFGFNIIISSLMFMMYPIKTLEDISKGSKITSASVIILPLIICIASLKAFKNVTAANLFFANIFPYLLSIGTGLIILVIFFRILYLKKKNRY